MGECRSGWGEGTDGYFAPSLLLQTHGLEGRCLGAKVLPAHDFPISELEYVAHWNVYLDATSPCSHLELAPCDIAYPLDSASASAAVRPSSVFE